MIDRSDAPDIFAEHKAWVSDEVDPAEQEHELILTARFFEERRKNHARPKPKRTGRPPDFPRKRLIWFKACLHIRRDIRKTEDADDAAVAVGKALWFDVKNPKTRSRLERIGRGGDEGLYDAALERIEALSKKDRAKLRSEIAAIAALKHLERRALRASPTESPREGLIVPR